jgi:hypothetical protein
MNPARTTKWAFSNSRMRAVRHARLWRGLADALLVLVVGSDALSL